MVTQSFNLYEFENKQKYLPQPSLCYCDRNTSPDVIRNMP